MQAELMTVFDRNQVLALLGVPEALHQASFYLSRTSPARKAYGGEALEFSVAFYDEGDDPRVECDVSAVDPGERELALLVVARRRNGQYVVGEGYERPFDDFMRLLQRARADGLTFVYAGEA
ncbi:MAG: hypothetical protein ING52_10615 [Burkholderiales bacterium]|jgi:endonuclease YncB( thermonuclease family)|nr:hypothetical protein [Burkholderiales bacterium]